MGGCNMMNLDDNCPIRPALPVGLGFAAFPAGLGFLWKKLCTTMYLHKYNPFLVLEKWVALDELSCSLSLLFLYFYVFRNSGDLTHKFK